MSEHPDNDVAVAHSCRIDAFEVSGIECCPGLRDDHAGTAPGPDEVWRRRQQTPRIRAAALVFVPAVQQAQPAGPRLQK